MFTIFIAVSHITWRRLETVPPPAVPPEELPPLLVTLVLGLTANTIVEGCWFLTRSFFNPVYQPSEWLSPGLLIAVIICAFPLLS